MSRVMNLTRGAALVALAGALTACEPDVDIVGTEPPSGGAMFTNYVALGNSITAGYQSSGINDSTQRRSYANLFAQAAGTRFAYPQLAAPGCPPPIVSFPSGRGGPAQQPFTANTCALRSDAGATDRLNNVAVPGALVIDPTASTSTSSNLLTTLILGGKSQVQRALDVDPTFASIWIGNNDVLGAAVRGILVPNQAVNSPGVTPVNDFTARYDAMLDELLADAPELEGALFGVVQVQNTPILFQVGVLLANAQAKGAFDLATGWNPASPNPAVNTPVTILPNCTAAPTTLVSFALAGQIAAYRQANGASGHPPIISCGVTPAFPAPVGEAFILTTDEQTALTTTVNDYNAHIQARANELGWAYVDVNPRLAELRTQGAVPPFPNLASTTATFGPYFSLDGIHPSTAAHVLIANLMIQSVNAKYNLQIPPVN